MKEFKIAKEDAGQTAIKYLGRILKDAPKGLLYKQIRKKNITLNGKKMEGNEKLSAGDVISVFMSEDTIKKFQGETVKDVSEYEEAFIKFGKPHIIYEDDDVIFLDKPVGMLSQKSENADLSANEWLIGYMLSSNSTDAEKLSRFTPSVCNRLDRNTGGILLFGKTLPGTTALSKTLKERNFQKFYKTVVFGQIVKSEFIKGYISKDENINKVTVYDKETPGCDYIETGYMPLRFNKERNLTELEVELVTGKPHQIRAHLASIKHPIIGDAKYGNVKLNDGIKKEFGLKNQLLFAYKVVFPVNFSLENLAGKTFTVNFDNIFDRFF